jgi:hypothetical protein
MAAAKFKVSDRVRAKDPGSHQGVFRVAELRDVHGQWYYDLSLVGSTKLVQRGVPEDDLVLHAVVVKGSQLSCMQYHILAFLDDGHAPFLKSGTPSPGREHVEREYQYYWAQYDRDKTAPRLHKGAVNRLVDREYLKYEDDGDYAITPLGRGARAEHRRRWENDDGKADEG